MLVKDLRVEGKRGFEVLASIGFISTASLALAQAAYKSLAFQLTIPGLWVTLIFLAVFTSTTSFTREADKKTLPGLKLIPASPVELFLEKTVFTLILVLSLGIVEIVLLSVFSAQPSLISFRVFSTFTLVSIHLSAVASFVSALVMYSEGRAFLIPMLIFVLTFPIIPLATSIASFEGPIPQGDLVMLAGETVLMLVTASALSEYVLRV